MRLLLTADLHITSKVPLNRKDDYLVEQKRKVEWIFNLASKSSCDAILVAGDFFDSPVLPFPLLAEYIRLITEFNIPVYCVFGQHDTAFRRRQNTALAFLEELGVVAIAGREPISLGEGVFLYGASYDEEIPVPTQTPAQRVNILLAHVLITTPETKPWFGFKEIFPLRKVSAWAKGYSLIVCGDNHKTLVRDKGKRLVFNPGSLMRSRVDQADHRPVVAVWRSPPHHSLKIVEVPILPAQAVLDLEGKEQSEEFVALMRQFVRAVEEYDVGVDFLSNLFSAMRAAKSLPPSVKKIIYDAVERCGYGNELQFKLGQARQA